MAVRFGPHHNAGDFAMKKLVTFAAVAGCVALSACGGGTTEDTVNADNMMMTDNLGTTDMNAGMDMNMDMNATDMNAVGNTTDNMSGTMNETGNTTGNSL